MELKFHGTLFTRFHPWLPALCDKADLFIDNNGVGRAGLQPLRGGFHLFQYLRYSHHMHLSLEDFLRLLFSSTLFLFPTYYNTDNL